MESHSFIEAARWLSRRIISPKRRYDKLSRNLHKTNNVLDEFLPDAVPTALLCNGQPSYGVDRWLG
jgi:hypothetical protein